MVLDVIIIVESYIHYNQYVNYDFLCQIAGFIVGLIAAPLHYSDGFFQPSGLTATQAYSCSTTRVGTPVKVASRHLQKIRDCLKDPDAGFVFSESLLQVRGLPLTFIHCFFEGVVRDQKSDAPGHLTQQDGEANPKN